jgi:hypothetical protein
MQLAAIVLACTPAIPGVGDVIPPSGANGVGSNVRVIFETTVRGPGVTTMVTMSSASGSFSGPGESGEGGVWTFDPAVPLAAGNWLATITVEGPGGTGTKSVTFSAVSSSDLEGPVFATGDVDFDVGAYVDAGPVDDCPDPPPVYAVATDWPDATDGASGILYAVNGILYGQSDAVLAAAPDAEYVLQVFAFDETGNATALPPATLNVPGPPGAGGGGCSCALGARAESRAPIAPLLLSLAALAALSRRRR